MDAMNDLRRVFFVVIFVSMEVLIVIPQGCLVGVFVYGKSVVIAGDVGTVPLLRFVVLLWMEIVSYTEIGRSRHVLYD